MIMSIPIKRRELLGYLLEEQQIEKKPDEVIRRRELTDKLPLSYAQQRLWFLDQLQPGTSHYNIYSVVRLSAQLDVVALERSLNEMMRRHESLRTTFVAIGGEPQQVIHAQMEIGLEVTELSGMAEGKREAEARRLVGKEAKRPFELSQGPLLRARLLKLSEAEHVLVLVLHHIVSDGWSMGVFSGELAALYEAYREGRESPLEELGIQYADYAVWQREQMQGERLAAELGYWRRQL